MFKRPRTYLRQHFPLVEKQKATLLFWLKLYGKHDGRGQKFVNRGKFSKIQLHAPSKVIFVCKGSYRSPQQLTLGG